MLARVAAALVLTAGALSAQVVRGPFVPVGVLVDAASGPLPREAIDELRRLRFNVVARRDTGAVPAALRVDAIPPPGEKPDAPLALSRPAGLEVVPVAGDATGDRVRQDAWVAIGRGGRGVLFDSWTTLSRNPAALAAGAAFADVVTRNAALFAPLEPSARTVRVEPASAEVFARLVESAEAMVLVAANLSDSPRQITLAFSADIPEAIWQNMEAGGAVNFVAGPEGPIYTRAFPPRDVIVLMIRKQYR